MMLSEELPHPAGGVPWGQGERVCNLSLSLTSEVDDSPDTGIQPPDGSKPCPGEEEECHTEDCMQDIFVRLGGRT